MNDHRLPPDEVASAFLDGELGAAEAEAVRRHPRLAARARALRGAADAVGEDVAPPPGAADAAVEAALADFDARRTSAAAPAQRRPRSLSVITGVAAAVAIGFIVAAAVGLFASRGAVEDAGTAAAPAPAPAAEAAAPAPAPADEPPPAAEPAADEAMALAPRTTAAAVEAFATTQATTAPLPLDPPEAAAAEPGAAPADAQAQAEAEAAEARAAAADTPAPEAAAAVAEPALAPAADETEAPDDAGPPPTLGADPAPEEACAGAIGDRTVELRLTLGGAPILVLGTSDGSLTALDGTTCAEIPPPDGTEMVADEALDGCAGAIGDGSVELRLTFNGARILVVRSADGSLSALDGATCEGIPAG